MCNRCAALRASHEAEREAWATERESLTRTVRALRRQLEHREPARITTTPRTGHYTRR